MDSIRNSVRSVMRGLAGIINTVSGGKISANFITMVGLLAHIPIAWLIASRHPIWAGWLLLIFGLFDALDGELARLQKKASAGGMLLDATADRFKEILVYTGAAYFFVATGRPYIAVWAVAACGASLCVSYVKAKGETAVVGNGLSANDANRVFQDGILRFEVRMFLVIVGLLTHYLDLTLAVIAILGGLTAIQRLIQISKKL